MKRVLPSQPIAKGIDQSISPLIDHIVKVEVICFQFRMDGKITSAAKIRHKCHVLTQQSAGEMKLHSQVRQSRFICRVNEKFSGSSLRQRTYCTITGGDLSRFRRSERILFWRFVYTFVTNESVDELEGANNCEWFTDGCIRLDEELYFGLIWNYCIKNSLLLNLTISLIEINITKYTAIKFVRKSTFVFYEEF